MYGRIPVQLRRGPAAVFLWAQCSDCKKLFVDRRLVFVFQRSLTARRGSKLIPSDTCGTATAPWDCGLVVLLAG